MTIEITRNGYGIHIDRTDGRGALNGLTDSDAQELLDKLQALLHPRPTPPEMAWVVVASSPGMPVTKDGPRTGVNMLPCDLQEAQNAVDTTAPHDVREGLLSLGEAFELAWKQHPSKRWDNPDQAAYIIDHGDGRFTVAL